MSQTEEETPAVRVRSVQLDPKGMGWIEATTPDCVVIDGVCHRPSCVELFGPETQEAK